MVLKYTTYAYMYVFSFQITLSTDLKSLY
uniref:Uncharacterized protein n=1 Tax=Arundo donax TaxID=35708 RepID=A0A0A8Y8R0_ARUDO